jgi:pyruvate formate lyase activating enzyme
MSPAEVLSGLGRYRPFLSGITVSGGECGLQAQFLQALVEAARDEGLPALVDTNGSTDYSLLPGLVEAAAGFMLDVKAWDEADHLALTGAPNRNVLANLRFLLAAGKLYEARTVVAPGLFDAASTVREVARAIAAAESRAPSAGSARRAAVRYKLIRFRPQGVRDAWRSLSTPDDAEMEALADSARSEGAREVVVV